MGDMKAALLPDRGVVKVAGDDARNFLNGLLTADIGRVTPEAPCFAALLTPQGKIVVDVIVAEAPAADGGGFFLDVPRALVKTLVDKLNFYKLRAKVLAEDRSEVLGVMAAWDATATTDYGLCYATRGLPASACVSCCRRILPRAAAAISVPGDRAGGRVSRPTGSRLGVPRGGLDFKLRRRLSPRGRHGSASTASISPRAASSARRWCSRMEHRGNARSRIVPVAYDGFPPDAGAAVTAGGKPVGTFGSSAAGRALALLRLDRAEDALAAGQALTAGAVTLRLVKPDWMRFKFPGER